MDFTDLLRVMRFEYWANYAAVPDNLKKYFVDFYEYLLRRGFNRWQLSAHGIGKDVQA